MKNLVNSLKQGVVVGIGFILVIFLAGASYAAWVSLTDVATGDTLTADVFNKVLENQRVLDSKVMTRNYCYGTSYAGHDTTSAAWANLNGFTGCNIETTGRQIKITMDFSVYGIHHGGIRLIDNTTGTVYGTNATYGFDWVFPVPDNNRYKRTITRILNVPAGVHDFGVQVKSQATGSRFYIHPGTESENYSGFHLIVEEL